MDLQESDMDSHWQTAGEILQRIQLLEKKVFLFVNVYYDILVTIYVTPVLPCKSHVITKMRQRFLCFRVYLN